MFPPDWKAIASEVRELDIRSAIPIGEGWTAVAYRVNEELVFKFPKGPEDWQELDREIAFLEYARPALPLPTPEHLYRLRESAGAPNGYAVYRHLPGAAVQPDRLSPRGSAALAEQLAGFLRALHDMEAGPLASILPCEDQHAVAQDYRERAEEQIAPHLSEAERHRLRAMFARHVDIPANFTGRPRILHADLSIDHVLCVDDAITGIIDWGDVSLGDPDYDFGYLWEDCGESFVREMAVHYGHPDPERLMRKARYFTIVDQVGTILDGGDRALPGDVAESWVRLRVLLQHDA
jgi:aminoglycoside 2''-phosphotransferase